MTPTLPAVEESIPQQDPAQPYGENNKDLPKQLQDALKARIKAIHGQEQYLRRQEVMRDRRLRFYARGRFHVYEGRDGVFTQAQPGGIINVGGREEQCPAYVDDYDIFTPFLWIIEAVQTENPPGIAFKPVNPSLSEDIEAAETAEGWKEVFNGANDVKGIQQKIVRMNCLSGRTVLWTRTEADAERFGLGPDGAPKQMECADVFGTLETKVPVMAADQKAAGYCFIYIDQDVAKLKSKYPGIASQIKANMPGLGENPYERTARLGVLQGIGRQALADAFSHLGTEQHSWLRAWNFAEECFSEPFTEAEMVEGATSAQTVGEKLTELFPLGVHAAFVGDVYGGSWPESMDDHITIGFPFEGDGMSRDPIMLPMVTVTDRFNDSMNGIAENFDTGWSSIWVDGNEADLDSITEQTSSPNAIRMHKARTGMPMEHSFFREPPAELPATFMSYVELLMGQLPQFILGTPPAIFGAAMEDQKTASGYSLARNQAMGRQGIIWASVQSMMASMYYQAAKAASVNPCHAEAITVPGPNGMATLTAAKMADGKFTVKPDEDSSFPETTPQKRSTLNGMIALAEANPVVGAQIMSSPRNWETISTVMGTKELCIPEAVAWRKQTFEIEQLLKMAPIPADPAMIQAAQMAHTEQALMATATGQPVPQFDPKSMDQPSIPVDPECDHHQWEWNAVQDYLQSAERRQQDAQGNTEGVRNVRLHGLAHKALIPAPAPMPMPAAHPQLPAAKPKEPAAPVM